MLEIRISSIGWWGQAPLNLISTVFSYLLLFFSMILSNKLNDYRVLIYINAISIGFMALGMDWIYGVYEDYVYITVRQIIVQLITIILMFILVHNKEDIYVCALIGVIPYAIANVINVYKARKYFDFRKISRPNIKKHICPILILFATQVSAKVYSSLDTILLGFFTNDVRTGLYSAAIKVNSILITLFTAMPPVFIPTIMDYIKKK